MSDIIECDDISDLNPLYAGLGLYLKPIARVNISIHYPTLKQSLTNNTTKTVSSWDLIEKIKTLASPEKFLCLKTTISTMEFVRFEGDLENRQQLKNIITRLEGKALKVTGFKEPLKILISEAKSNFPLKYTWDSFFRDAKDMNEMKPGERPDTIHFQNIPSKWFSKNPLENNPSERILKQVFNTFGEVRCVDIPSTDPYRSRMRSNIAGIQTFTYNTDNVFEAYVQFKDYLSFVKVMDALRGQNLFLQTNTKSYVAFIKVDFDKTKHLSEESIKRRAAEREILAKEEVRRAQIAKRKNLLANETSEAKREKLFKNNNNPKGDEELQEKIELEQSKYMSARRKLEAIRLVDYLFESLKRTKLREERKLKEDKERRDALKLKEKKFKTKAKHKERSYSPEYSKNKIKYSDEDERRRSDGDERKRPSIRSQVVPRIPAPTPIQCNPNLPLEFQFSTRFYPPPRTLPPPMPDLPMMPTQQYPQPTHHPPPHHRHNFNHDRPNDFGGPFYNKNYINDWEIKRDQGRRNIHEQYGPPSRIYRGDMHNNHHHSERRSYEVSDRRHSSSSYYEVNNEVDRAYDKYFKSLARKSSKPNPEVSEEPTLEQKN